MTLFGNRPDAAYVERGVLVWLVVGTRRHGLSLLCHGTVFVNPSFGRMLGAWVAKCRREVETGRAQTVVALLPAR